MTLTRMAFLFFAMGAVAVAQHPNFSGTWHINFAESDFSDKRAPIPDRLVLTIQQKGDTFGYHSLRGKVARKGSTTSK